MITIQLPSWLAYGIVIVLCLNAIDLTMTWYLAYLKWKLSRL